ncbi:Acetyl-coenzyme A carboxylase carboxyl transferase subunit beta [Caprobacter fermentans]|uniref:Acetyl-coenzyme A carboxylase carboxyl transferase subunit beta n=1 Tax=Caproicibacter fermentans TaxID=2576756 RepID=A0A6N8I007_9FIRM|nr:acetyl-CoA carboxylase, carboxyltransferase subunit beta [Caproicibacter fermentans]MVB11474.1 Acetyl-coenzyme A carboxylase carboxyl transferase subunit beta [Caproicibacter fermentans]OCN02307.1 acetyl-CoA carboxylase subunit beta [Clostridium sp. W14A]QNK40992.1 acetyl-CoA carboxylase carboxyltransferase subunit beta [Caproicibacter fermentans]
MIRRGIFKHPKNDLEGEIRRDRTPGPSVPEELCVTCPTCRKMLFRDALAESSYVCPHCGWHFRISARRRIEITADEGTFRELNTKIVSRNILSFPGYDEKLEQARRSESGKDEVVCGTCRIGGFTSCVFAMEPSFMMGSMGTAVGEKITRLFEYAAEHRLPVVGFTVSGGARMQEGILSLMQMAKTSGAVRRHSEAGLLYVAVLTNPTTGGVTASFAMEADIILAEPGALIGFAGPRVIEQTIRQKLPPGFQRAEFLLEKGFVDQISNRKTQKRLLTRLLEFHAGGADE